MHTGSRRSRRGALDQPPFVLVGPYIVCVVALPPSLVLLSPQTHTQTPSIMGVNGLWPVSFFFSFFFLSPSFTRLPFSDHVQLLAPAATPISIRHFAIRKGFVENVRGDRTLWVGIDAR